jgi:hypothetical protein
MTDALSLFYLCFVNVIQDFWPTDAAPQYGLESGLLRNLTDIDSCMFLGASF